MVVALMLLGFTPCTGKTGSHAIQKIFASGTFINVMCTDEEQSAREPVSKPEYNVIFDWPLHFLDSPNNCSFRLK
jgi:hypothetical protein